MARALRRRDVLAAMGLTPVAAIGALRPAYARDPAAMFEPEVMAHPVTARRAAVAVDAGSRRHATTLVVADEGREIGRAKLTRSGTGVVPVVLPEHGRRTVTAFLTRGGSSVLARSVTLTTEADELRDSLWRVVNKGTPAMGKTEKPGELVQVEGVELDPRAGAALSLLLAHAEDEKIGIRPSNGFRSYTWQHDLYQSYAQRDGRAEADKFSARPGHSEHQTGMAFDAKAADGTCDLEECFGATREGRFLADQARAAGFVVRYTEENQKVTGYQPEPWHLRYVGPWLARHLDEAKVGSLEEAFGMRPALRYRS